ncbi:MAG: hypothetical protein MUE44_04355 [Oscillatoriaceae cyanobacterium Prado104]|nr:hypothetical protein [Oscillatoriaceae cyanobacterium Prado104]
MSFKNYQEPDFIPYKYFWGAIVTAYAVANAPVDRIYGLIFTVLQNLPIKGLERFLTKYNNEITQAQISSHFIVSIKGFLFFVAFLMLAYPIVLSVGRSRKFWEELGIKRIAVVSLYFFVALSLLVFPYSYPHVLLSHPSGLASLGVSYGQMSLSPFAESYEIVARRLLKPAIAYFIQMQGYILYYLFSLICIYTLIFMTVCFLESKIESKHKFGEIKPAIYTRKFWVYLSAMTSSYAIVCFQWPGYPENITFILILLAACLPMSSLARLGTVALCMVNHDGSAFALIPIIWFCFPKKERIPALVAVVLFYGIWFASHGLNLQQGLESHVVVGGKKSTLSLLAQHPIAAAAGTFFACKLLWFLVLFASWRLWLEKEQKTAIAIVGITVFPLLMLVLGWDTTRLTGFGFLGMLIALVAVANQYGNFHKNQRQLLLAAACANILLPTYNVALDIPESAFKYPYPGIYKAIGAMLQLIVQ